MQVPTSVAALTFFLVACGKTEGGPPKTEDSPKPPSPTAPSTSGERPKATAPAAPTETVMAFVGDDPGKAVKLSGPSAWTLGPADSWSLGRFDYVRAEGTKNVFKSAGSDALFAVPAAYGAEPSSEARRSWKKGDAVLVGPTRTAECGRVIEVTPEGVKVGFEWAEKGETTVALPHDLLPITGRLELGAPVAYKSKPEDEGYRFAYFVYGDGKEVWLTGKKRVPTALVQAIDVMRTFKKGDKVFAATLETKGLFRPATFADSVEGGARYEVMFADGKKGTAKFCRVTSALP